MSANDFGCFYITPNNVIDISHNSQCRCVAGTEGCPRLEVWLSPICDYPRAVKRPINPVGCIFACLSSLVDEKLEECKA